MTAAQASGGVGVQMADEAIECGLEVTPMSDDAQARLKAGLPYASPRNPVDITAQAFNDRGLIRANLEVMLDEGTYDSIVAFFTFVAAAESMVNPIREALQDARQRHPNCLLLLSIVAPPEIIRRYEEVGCPVFEDASRAVRTVSALARLHETFARPNHRPDVKPASTPLPTAPIDEQTAKRLFADAGLAVVPHRLCHTSSAAVEAAAKLGYPVALKIASPDIVHKSDIGGVALHLNAAEVVREQFAAITEKARLAYPDAHIEGVLVSPMVTGGVEMILGIQNDPTFGPVVMCGLGGIFVETLHDIVFRVAPFDVDEAHRMLAELRGVAVLNGVRGQAPGDIKALATALSSLSRFATAHAGHLDSAELNPVVVLPAGRGVVALDALIVPKTDP